MATMHKPTNLEKAEVQIVLDHPFFASILLKHPLTAREDIPTLAVDKRGKIYYNPKFVESLPVRQLVWGLCHEVMHVIDLHALRMQGRDPKAWNWAGDAYINDILDDCKIGERIPGCVDKPGSKDKSVEEIYEALPESPQGGGGSGRPGKGDPSNGQGDGVGDDLLDEGEPVSEAEAKEIAGQMKVDLAQAAQNAKMRGKLPGVLEKMVADLLASKVAWHAVLEHFMVGMTAQDYNWRRPNRRYASQGMYLPSIANEPSMGTIALQVDISGSVSQREIAYYNGHMQRIIEMCHPEKVIVMYCDTDVQICEEFGPEDYPVQISYHSGGGTHMPAGFDYLIENSIEADVLVVLTDGYTDFGNQEDCPCPVVWCISSEVQAPWGVNVHFEME